jgi:hypothetical protein
VNQCDGCAAGLPLIDGKHYINSHPEMVCQKNKYNNDTVRRAESAVVGSTEGYDANGSPVPIL